MSLKSPEHPPPPPFAERDNTLLDLCLYRRGSKRERPLQFAREVVARRCLNARLATLLRYKLVTKGGDVRGEGPFPIKITLFAVRLARISDYFALLSLRNDGEPRVYFGIKRFSPGVVGFARYYLSGPSTEKGKQPRVSIVPGRNCAPDKGVALGALVTLASRQEARHISPSVIGRGGGSRRERRRRKKDGRARENGKPRSRKHFST